MENKNPYLMAVGIVTLLAVMSIPSLQTSAFNDSPATTITVHGRTIHITTNSTLTTARRSTSNVVTYTTYVYSAHRIFWCTYPFVSGISWDEISYTVAWTVLSTNHQIVGYYNPGDPSFSWGGLGCGLEFSTASNSATLINPYTVHWYAGFNLMFGACPACYGVGTDFISINGYSSGSVSASWS